MEYTYKVYYCNNNRLLMNYLLIYVDNDIPYKIEDYNNGKIVNTIWKKN